MNLLKKYFSAFTSIIVFIIYLFTLAPSVIQIDSGELATVQYTLGIAHPTGYPLFTMLGFLFLQIPLGIRKITQANLLAAIWSAFAIYFFIKVLIVLLINVEEKKNNIVSKKKQKTVAAIKFNEDQKIFSIIAAAFFLAFSKTFWMQSTSVEVYSFQTMLFALILFFSFKAFSSKEEYSKSWSLVGLSFAFGFSNHMTTLLAIPFAAILFFFKEKLTTSSIKIIFKTLVLSIPVLVLIYLYLPIRAAQNPIMNWGNPINFENFWRHFTGKQYQVWLFASFEATKKQLGNFVSNFPSEFTIIGLFIGLIGFIFLYKIDKKIFLTTLATFLFAVLYSVNYDIVDLDSYFLLAYMIFSIWILFGFLLLFSKLEQLLKTKRMIIPIFTILIFVPLASNKSEVDQSDVYTFEDYTKTILNGAEKNSIILSYQWDYFISASYYFQNVEHFRKDVVIVDKELLRRSWYYNQLKRNHSDAIKKIDDEVNQFLIALQPFEKNDNYDAQLLEKNYQAVMTNLIAKNIEERNCYIGIELFQNEMQRNEFNLPAGFQIVPYNLLFKVVKGNQYVEAPLPNFTIRFPKSTNRYIDFIKNTIATILTYRAAYEIQFNKIERAKIYLEKVKKDFPDYIIPANILQSAGL